MFNLRTINLHNYRRPKPLLLKRTLLTLAMSPFLCLPAAQAATLIVDTNIDSETDDSTCSLRRAIRSINGGSAIAGCTNSGGTPFGTEDSIEFDDSLGSTLTLTSNLPGFSTSAIVAGPSDAELTIDGVGRFSIFGVFQGSEVSVQNLTIQDGTSISGAGAFRVDGGSNLTVRGCKLFSNRSSFRGGAISVEGGSTLVVSDSLFSENDSGSGGAIRADDQSRVYVYDSTFHNNSAQNRGGAIALNGRSSLVLHRSEIRNNATFRNTRAAGIIAVNSSTVSVFQSTIEGNQGNGLEISYGGTLTLSESTVSSNISSRCGAGVRMYSGSSASIINSTVSGNSATGGITRGGGICFRDASAGIVNSTITGNSAGLRGGGVFLRNAQAIISNTIISSNYGDGGYSKQEISTQENTRLRFSGRNVLGDSSSESIGTIDSDINLDSPNIITATSDGTQPTALEDILSPLADNGGSTMTHALPAGSPAINRASQDVCDEKDIETDQRGESRMATHCDIGAFESAFIEPAPIPDPDDSSCYVVKAKNGKTLVFCL